MTKHRTAVRHLTLVRPLNDPPSCDRCRQTGGRIVTTRSTTGATVRAHVECVEQPAMAVAA